jgi:hypothetical protein
MGIAYNTSIVMDGLLSFWDASNIRSYPGSGTTWLDISSYGYNLAARNSPTFTTTNGISYFTLNGTNQDFYLASYGPAFTSITFNMWVWRNGTQNGYTGLVMSRGNASGFTYQTGGTTLGYHWLNDGGTYTYSSGIDTANQTWSMATLVITATDAKWYLNGILQNTRIASHASSTFSNLYIGSDSGTGGRYYNGRISMVQMYNRALSAAEIKTNYNATKKRYGL